MLREIEGSLGLIPQAYRSIHTHTLSHWGLFGTVPSEVALDMAMYPCCIRGRHPKLSAFRWHAICVDMSIQLSCDAPGCREITTDIPVTAGGGHFDLRSSGWWLVPGSAGPVTACCSDHLDAAVASRRPHLAVMACDEAAYA